MCFEKNKYGKRAAYCQMSVKIYWSLIMALVARDEVINMWSVVNCYCDLADMILGVSCVCNVS